MRRLPKDLAQTKGTSLAELLMVLGLVSVATAIAATYLLAAVPKSQLAAATAELAVEIRAAHRLAIAQRTPIRVTFDPSISLLRMEPAYQPQQVLRWYDYGRRGVGAIRLSRGTSVVFYPNGRTASPVTVTLITRRGETSNITVSITGKVTWS